MLRTSLCSMPWQWWKLRGWQSAHARALAGGGEPSGNQSWQWEIKTRRFSWEDHMEDQWKSSVNGEYPWFPILYHKADSDLPRGVRKPLLTGYNKASSPHHLIAGLHRCFRQPSEATKPFVKTRIPGKNRTWHRHSKEEQKGMCDNP